MDGKASGWRFDEEHIDVLLENSLQNTNVEKPGRHQYGHKMKVNTASDVLHSFTSVMLLPRKYDLSMIISQPQVDQS